MSKNMQCEATLRTTIVELIGISAEGVMPKADQPLAEMRLWRRTDNLLVANQALSQLSYSPGDLHIAANNSSSR